MKKIAIFFLFSFVLLAQVERPVKTAFGTIAFYDTLLTLDLELDEWRHVTNDTKDLFETRCKNKCFVKDDALIVKRPGSYEVEASVTCAGQAGTHYSIGYEVNDTMYIGNRWHYAPTHSDEMTTSFITNLQLRTNDVIKMMVRNTINSKDLVIHSVTITFIKKDI